MRRLCTILMVPFFLAACSAPTAAPVAVELTIPEGGLPEPIVQRVELGAEVTLRITAEVDDELHVHGYELHIVTPAGETVEEVFEANMAGRYEIESHDAGQIYMNLVVA